MPATRLFVNQRLVAHSEIALTDEAARYVGRVMRCRPGDTLVLFDGSGFEYAASIASISKLKVAVQVAAATRPDIESPLTVRLLQGISRGDRMDHVVQKATELGARRITPVLTEFSVVRLDADRAAKRRHHWQRIAESACEQCGRNVPPAIDHATALPAALSEDRPNSTTRLLLLPDATQSLAAVGGTPDSVELLIGPEGGFSAGEAQAAVECGFVPVSLGPRVLRTETAAVVALTIVQSLWGDLAARD